MTATSTVADATRSAGRLRRGQAWRRLFAVVLVAFVVAGLGLVFGERMERVSAVADGYELTVEYPSRTRGGMTRDIEIVVRRRAGFDGPVTVALSHALLRVFEQQGTQPQPVGATATGERVEWSFDPPRGDTLRVLVDVRVEPHRFRGASGRLWVLDGSDEVVSVPLDTRVMP